MSDFTRYIVPNGGGVTDHPSGLLYLRQDVDPVVDALHARIRELEAAKERAENTLALADDQRREWEHHCKTAEAERDALKAKD